DMFLQGQGDNCWVWSHFCGIGGQHGPIGQYMALSTGSGFALPGCTATEGGDAGTPCSATWTWSQPTTDWSEYFVSFADFNGDGRADMFLQGQGSWLNNSGEGLPPAPIGVYMGLSTGTSFTQWTWSQPSTDWSQYRISFADFNGDATADLFLS